MDTVAIKTIFLVNWKKINVVRRSEATNNQNMVNNDGLHFKKRIIVSEASNLLSMFLKPVTCSACF